MGPGTSTGLDIIELMLHLHALAGTLIFAATLAVVMARPYGITEASAAMVGAVLMVLGGYVRPSEALALLRNDWNVYGFFLGMMMISALADQAGLLEAIVASAARGARGSSRRLYVAVFGVGILITVFLSNDSTALILTPVVYALATRLRLPVMPFMFACTFIADTASFVLPVSNPINILFLDALGGHLGTFFRYLLLPSLFCIGLNITCFLWLFRADLRLRYSIPDPPDAGTRDPRFFNFAAVVLTLTAIAYVAFSALQIPISAAALGGSGLLVAGAIRYGRMNWRELERDISWSLFFFIGGMLIVIKAVEHLGLTIVCARALSGLARQSPRNAILVTAGAAALGANIINNVPMALAMISVLGTLRGTAAKVPMVYAAILGADLGPNLTTVGSLATMIWLMILRRKGLEVSRAEYFRLGLTVVPVMIVGGALLIWLRL